MKETVFQAKIVKMLKERGCMILNLHGHAMQAPGWPDLYVVHQKWTGWIELKVGKYEMTGLQKVKIRELRKRGAEVVVLRLHEDGVIEAEETRSSMTLRSLNKDTILVFLQECCNVTE